MPFTSLNAQCGSRRAMDIDKAGEELIHADVGYGKGLCWFWLTTARQQICELEPYV